jgi:hypothetical protein
VSTTGRAPARGQETDANEWLLRPEEGASVIQMLLALPPPAHALGHVCSPTPPSASKLLL